MARRRRVLLVAAAVCAGALLLARPGGDDSGGAPSAPAGQDPPPVAAPPPPGDPGAGARNDPGAGPTAATGPAATSSPIVPPVEPHDHRGVPAEETLPPAAAGEAIATAERFAAIWAAAEPDWYARLAPLATGPLGSALAGADPPAPAPDLTGGGQLLFEAPAWARVGVPAARGTLVLDVLLVEDRWLVSAVDWWPA